MRYLVSDAAGAPLDAHFEVSDSSIIFHSRGGTRGTSNARNTEYAPALRLLLQRLVEADCAIAEITVDSDRVQELPVAERRILSSGEAADDPAEMFRLLSRRMQQVGRAADSVSSGNSNKRLRITLAGALPPGRIVGIVGGIPAQAGAMTFTPRGEQASLPGRVWVTSFWGFGPEDDGYLGFTQPGDRAWFMRNWQSGDLVMVYATTTGDGDDAERGRVLGFLEVERREIRDRDRMSPKGTVWKQGAGVEDRWTYAVPVVRAWRTIDPPLAREIAPQTLGPGANWQLIAKRCALLQPDETAAALEIPVRPADVFGEAALGDDEKARVYVPSRGFPLSFGTRTSITTDGEHFLYAMQFQGETSYILDEPAHALRGKVVVKVGLARDPQGRLGQLNAGFPPGGRIRWKLMLKSGALPDGDSALAAETRLKEQFAKRYRSLGGEFFLCDERTIAAAFAENSRPGGTI